LPGRHSQPLSVASIPKGEAVEVTDKDIIARARGIGSLRFPAFPGVLRKKSPMSRTRAELRFKVLAIITGGDVGQEPSAEDADAIDKYIDDARGDLSAKTASSTFRTRTISRTIRFPFAEYVANAAADEFGGKMDGKGSASSRTNCA
jgi:hypothetical protein